MTDTNFLQPLKPGARLLPAKLGMIILLMDVVAILAALFVTVNLVHWFPEFYRSKSAVGLNGAVMDSRSYYYLVLCLLMLVSFANKGHYSRRVPWWGQVQFIAKIVGIAFVFDGFTYFSLQLPFSRLLILTNWMLAGLLLLAMRRLAFFIVSRSRQWKLPVILLGDAQMVTDCMSAFYADGLTGYEVKVIMLRTRDEEVLDLSFLPKEHPPIEVVEANEIFDSYIRENPGFFYVISLDGFRGFMRDRLMRALEDTNTEYAIIPPIKRLHLHGMEPHYFFGNDIMLLHKRYTIRAPMGRIVKRGMDMVVSGLALPLIGLLAIAVMIMKRVERSESPVFYGGPRVGMKDRLFPCWKFCTMRPNAERILEEMIATDPAAKLEWDKYKKLKNDPRVDSNISRFLRKTSLDELPQLWNVFIGDMSLVGPRPILPEQRVDYGDALSQYASVRPGLTGLWQVSGRNETSFQQRMYWDSWYIRNWSIWHDIVILFKTVRVLSSGSGAY